MKGDASRSARSGYAFCRYVDDCNICVRNQVARDRILASISQFLSERLKLTINEVKSAVARQWERRFLGDSLIWQKAPKLRIAPASLQRLEGRIREVLNGTRGCSIRATIEELNPMLQRWAAYFKRPIPIHRWRQRRIGSGANCAASGRGRGSARILASGT